uniref:Transmembrane protein 61 n=1 Tax=Erpetoichthys calabaricus TaxID=27687 RepID=A0A8C4SXQ6_ERPCA
MKGLNSWLQSAEGWLDLLMCDKKQWFARFLIFGFLLLSVGLLVTVIGFWFPPCDTQASGEHSGDGTSPATENKTCNFLTLQILGPLVSAVGIALLVIGCIRRKQNLIGSQEDAPLPAEQPDSLEPCQITIGETVVIFPPPPPAYFPDAPPLRNVGGSAQSTYSSPPSYYSTFNQRLQVPVSEGRRSAYSPGAGSIFTITIPSISMDSVCHFNDFYEPPPAYEKSDLDQRTSIS